VLLLRRWRPRRRERAWRGPQLRVRPPARCRSGHPPRAQLTNAPRAQLTNAPRAQPTDGGARRLAEGAPAAPVRASGTAHPRIAQPPKQWLRFPYVVTHFIFDSHDDERIRRRTCRSQPCLRRAGVDGLTRAPRSTDKSAPRPTDTHRLCGSAWLRSCSRRLGRPWQHSMPTCARCGTASRRCGGPCWRPF
jgi:hypothetical protein